MTASRARLLALLGTFVLGLACAAALDAMGIGSFGPHRLSSLVGVALLGGVEAAAWPALLEHGVEVRRALPGAVVAGVLAFVLARAPFGWLDLGALGAGAPGDVPLLVVPLVTVVAVAATWPRAAATR
jgi:hypothetical protein